MNELSIERRAAVLSALVEGNSVRATCRQTGAAKGTVLALLGIVGAHCKNHHDRFVREVNTKRVQCDEIWSFVGAKAKRIPTGEKKGRGDAWTWVALDPDSKLVISYMVGLRDYRTGRAFMQDLSHRLANRVQLTTDSLPIYLRTVDETFNWNGADYAMLDKLFGPSQEGERRYSPPTVVGTRKRWIMGHPADEHVSTSHVERQNLTMRMQMRRFTRLTNAFSKKLENHLFAIALHFTHYNYCRPHATLTRAAGGVRTTPAMAVGLTDRVWTADDILNLLRGE
jgi:IS1 family transposase